ncbi:MAG: glycerol-3-phosphate acyltransferase [Anaerolineales bacterium]|nr:glycerol-3-phosphate acyltransferase [Anaerolineales bacterium]
MLLLVLLAAYVVGSIPMGYVIVRAISGQDVRQVGSGRTGGTNAMRAAGLAAGVLTALLDALKGAAGVWLAQWLLPAETRALGMVLAGLAAILGHNYSVFLRFKGGAGGAPCVGAAMAIWPWSVLIIVPMGVLVWFGIGYASVATMSVAVITTLLFAYRTYFQQAPAEYILYGVGAFVLLAWALRPNIRRLLRGEERLIGWRAKRMKQAGVGGDSKGH